MLQTPHKLLILIKSALFVRPVYFLLKYTFDDVNNCHSTKVSVDQDLRWRAAYIGINWLLCSPIKSTNSQTMFMKQTSICSKECVWCALASWSSYQAEAKGRDINPKSITKKKKSIIWKYIILGKLKFSERRDDDFFVAVVVILWSCDDSKAREGSESESVSTLGVSVWLE